MDGVDLTNLIKCNEQYSSAVSNLEECYKCDWNDQIRDSYMRYISESKDISNRVKRIRCNIETINRELVDLHLNEFGKTADEICREVNAI